MSDALERLRHRQRPQVPQRDTSLSSGSNGGEFKVLSTVDTSTLRHLDTQMSKPPEVQEFQTKPSTLRLEAGLSDRLQEACRVHHVSREVLIEALFLQCEADPKIWATVVEEAQRRSHQRQQIANQRRAHSMMQRFGEGGM